MEAGGGAMPLVASCGAMPRHDDGGVVGVAKASSTSRGDPRVRQVCVVAGAATASTTTRWSMVTGAATASVAASGRLQRRDGVAKWQRVKPRED